MRRVIDVSRVPIEKRDDPRIDAEEKELLALLQVFEFRMATLVHEAAHAHYFEAAGVRDLHFRGPLIEYDSAADTFHASFAAIETVFPGPLTPAELARISASGGVVKRLLTDCEARWGDRGGDEDDFVDFVHKARLRFQFSAEEIDAAWKSASYDVARDLRSPAFRRQLWDRAREYDQHLLQMITPVNKRASKLCILTNMLASITVPVRRLHDDETETAALHQRNDKGH